MAQGAAVRVPMLPDDDGWKWYVPMVEMYTALLRTHTPFAVANYGDGEWSCILGKEGANVNGTAYDPELGERLADTLCNPVRQWFGYNPSRKLRAEAETWIRDSGVDVPWVYKEALSVANVHGQLAPFFRALRERDVVVVGGPHLADLPDDVVGPHEYVKTPASDAWREYDAIVDRLMHAAVLSSAVVLFAAGMASNLLVHRCRRSWSHGTYIDVGAILDPYVGVYSRKKYKTDWFQNEMMERNLS